MLLKYFLSQARIEFGPEEGLKAAMGVEWCWLRREEEWGQETRPARSTGAAHSTGRKVV